MVCLSRLQIFKGCLPQSLKIFLGPFLNTLIHIWGIAWLWVWAVTKINISIILKGLFYVVCYSSSR